MITSSVITKRKKNVDEGRPTMKILKWFHTWARVLELDYIFS